MVYDAAAWYLDRACNHFRVFDVNSYPDDLPMPAAPTDAGKHCLNLVCGAV
jgi:hypothetical protein